MKKSIAVSFLFLFMLAIASPVMATDNIQEPEKTEKKAEKKECCSEKKECCSEKKECTKEKKEACKKECSKK
jgi:Na+-transporting methylmalonyl-CoA/oxaloacetate decarboxylase gamma subunit